jgi:hypothetical protein
MEATVEKGRPPTLPAADKSSLSALKPAHLRILAFFAGMAVLGEWVVASQREAIEVCGGSTRDVLPTLMLLQELGLLKVRITPYRQKGLQVAFLVNPADLVGQITNMRKGSDDPREHEILSKAAAAQRREAILARRLKKLAA